MYRIINKNETSKCNHLRRAVGLGVFDGFHLAHRELAGTLVEKSIENNYCPCIYTFVKSSSGKDIKGSKKALSDGLIITEEKRREILFKVGIEEIIVQDFDVEFANISALDFLEEYLYKRLNTALIVVGFNFRFGKNREGDVNLMKDWAAGRGINVIVIDAVNYLQEKISSSRIKMHLQNGEINQVNAMLGRKYSVCGIVEPGKKLGRKLGFPTANIIPDKSLFMPLNGVYLTKTIIKDRVYESVTNIGRRPSTDGENGQIVSETVLLDLDMDLYGEYAEVMIMELLRKEEKFESLEQLSLQISKDVDNARLRHTMMEDFSILAKVNNVIIYGLKSQRFASNVLAIDFRTKLSKKTASENNLLSSVITATCKKYNSRPQFSKKLDSLYGAFIESHVESQGNLHISSYTADALNMEFNDENPFLETVELLFDLFENPDTDSKGHFREEIVESEKKSIISEIKARKNDKQRYAFDKCLDLYTGDTPFGIRSFGDIATLENISSEDLKKAFEDLKEASEISIYLAGKFDSAIVEKICDLTGKVFNSNNPDTIFTAPVWPQAFKGNENQTVKSESMEVEQSKICAVYKCPVSYFSCKMTAIGIFNVMLGGDVHSLLFQKVREEMGLAYSIYSSLLKYLSAVVLVAGVAHENVETALTAMDEQIKKIARGNYGDDLFTSSIASGIYANKSISDNLHSLLRFYSNNLVRGLSINPDASLDYLFTVKKEDIEKIASDVQVNTIYAVTGGKNDQ